MIAPTSAGLHPNLIRSGDERGGEHSGYEDYGTVNAQLSRRDAQLAVSRQLGSAQVAAGQASGGGILDWAAQHPFLVAGALLGAAWLYKKGLTDGDDGEIRDNPGPPQASMAPVVVMAPLAGSMTSTPSVSASAESPEKTRRRRRTSQARDAKGHYLSAGTRAKAVTEGK
jgi:hypothetical protein